MHSTAPAITRPCTSKRARPGRDPNPRVQRKAHQLEAVPALAGVAAGRVDADLVAIRGALCALVHVLALHAVASPACAGLARLTSVLYGTLALAWHPTPCLRENMFFCEVTVCRIITRDKGFSVCAEQLAAPRIEGPTRVVTCKAPQTHRLGTRRGSHGRCPHRRWCCRAPSSRGPRLGTRLPPGRPPGTPVAFIVRVGVRRSRVINGGCNRMYDDEGN